MSVQARHTETVASKPGPRSRFPGHGSSKNFPAAVSNGQTDDFTVRFLLVLVCPNVTVTCDETIVGCSSCTSFALRSYSSDSHRTEPLPEASVQFKSGFVIGVSKFLRTRVFPTGRKVRAVCPRGKSGPVPGSAMPLTGAMPAITISHPSHTPPKKPASTTVNHTSHTSPRNQHPRRLATLPTPRPKNQHP